MIMGAAALVNGWTVLTGDEQIRRRTAAPLIDALGSLGVEIFSSRGNGCAPILVKGPMCGGRTTVVGTSSQYLSSLLLACPLADGDTEISVTGLNERPYVHMTLDWLSSQGITIGTDSDLSRITVPGGQKFTSFSREIPGDFSSATFPLCAAALAGGEVTLHGLEMDDAQGDKRVIDILGDMGAEISCSGRSGTVKAASLIGVTVDMNVIPDALPMLAVTACFAGGETVLHNVAQARIKETDRIAVMAEELSRLGADIKELPDGLKIRGGGLRGGNVHGHGDHRVVMALTVAGFASDGPITVDTAEAADITYPGFWEMVRSLGGNVTLL
jgi:3-phosphoshikimate 1-carboxyvinyltransferase